MGKFDNKVVIVTGASSGIGASTAITFAREGAKVVVTGRNQERLNETSEKCKAVGAENFQILEVVADLEKFKNLESLVKKTVDKFGGIDILINNAGYARAETIETIELDTYEKIFNANLRAPVFLCKYALPHLKKTKGCVVNVNSCASLTAGPGGVPYSMTKIALDHFTRGFSAECAPFGVRVNCVNPAATDTRFGDNMNVTKEMFEKMLESFMKRQPLGVIKPQQISDAIVFLCQSPVITGINLPIDAGMLNAPAM
uniref:uncharacterized oxidoreductase TM_0325-like isoform X1 n=1 Tax=Styela clava TaxID=7725 RepID=UPI00193A3555|nr:uncharacterized oxidoreductase TM_0325-like isoform X1 [Styela clava]